MRPVRRRLTGGPRRSSRPCSAVRAGRLSADKSLSSVIPDLIRDPCLRATSPFGLSLSKPSSLPAFVVCLAPVGRGLPGGNSLFFVSPKKSEQKKSDPAVCDPPSLTLRRATCGARSSRGRARTRLRLRQSPVLIRLDLRSSAHTEGGGVGIGSGFGFGYAIGLRLGRALRVLASPYPHLFPPPVGLGRGAQPKTDQGERLSERSEFELDPVFGEHRRLPVAQRRDPDHRVAFLFLRFLWRSKEK
jgi:hypothetical protein